MECKLELINRNMGKDVYLMYQDIPSEELGSTNKIKNCSIDKFYDIIEEFKKEETIINPDLNTTTNRYIFFVKICSFCFINFSLASKISKMK